MGYTEQFNLLSPCYKDGEQPAGFRMNGGVKAKRTKKGTKAKKATKAKKPSTTKKVKKGKSSKQKGGSSCGASMSVAEMGVIDTTPASLPKSHSQDAFLERYSNNIMKGGENGNAVVVNNKKPAPIATNNLFSLNSPPATVYSKNSPLNKIKKELFQEGTAPELVMKIIETNKNSTNPAESTYSFEIFYRENGQNDIQKSSQSNVKYGQFFAEYRTISEKVFPRPPKNKNSVGLKPKTNSQTQANAKANANSQTQAKAKVNNSSSLLANNSNPTGARNNFP